MSKLRKGGLGHHFQEIKSLIELLPDKESISISYEKGDEHWKIMGKNGLPVHAALPITDDLAFLLNNCLEDASKVLIKKYNKIYGTSYKDFDSLIKNSNESKEKREFIEKLNEQNKLIEELQRKLQESNVSKAKERPVVDLIKLEEEIKSVDTQIILSDAVLVEEPVNKKLSDDNISKRLLGQLKGFSEWEKEHPATYSRPYTDTEALQLLIDEGCTDITGIIKWRVAVRMGSKHNPDIVTSKEKRWYKRATDKVCNAKARNKNKTAYKYKTTNSGKVNSIIDKILNNE